MKTNLVLDDGEPAAVVTRRQMLAHMGTGMSRVALTSLLMKDGVLAGDPSLGVDPARQVLPHHAAKAKRVIHIYLGGALSQVDSFDYKPELYKWHGKPMPSDLELDTFSGNVGLLHRPHFPFSQRGQSGLWVSDLFPHLAQVADELTVIHSNVADNANHTPATYQANTGFRNLGFPSTGAWVSYGLGSETEDLPSFVILPDARGMPHGEANLWSNAFLPAVHQGVVFRSEGQPLPNLHPSKQMDDSERLAQYEFLRQMNTQHMSHYARQGALSARIRSYDLAARMQLSAVEVAAINHETFATHHMYGLDRKECASFGRSCLLARRLLERGVRFVQLWSGTGLSWDAHGDITGKQHAGEAKRIDRPVAGLIRDLRARGLLDDTLVVCSTEFGRTPFAETAGGKIGKGRDHNAMAATNWLAGAGLKPGVTYGATDEFGYAAIENPVTVHDFHSTILHLLGINHERLTYYHNGIQRRLTNVHGHVIRDIIS